MFWNQFSINNTLNDRKIWLYNTLTAGSPRLRPDSTCMSSPPCWTSQAKGLVSSLV